MNDVRAKVESLLSVLALLMVLTGCEISPPSTSHQIVKTCTKAGQRCVISGGQIGVCSTPDGQPTQFTCNKQH